MNKKYVVELTEDEREHLRGIVKAQRMAAHKRNHARMLLKGDQGPHGPGWTDVQVANAFDCHRTTVENLRKRLAQERRPPGCAGEAARV